ncbi:MAG: stage 0 sporulation protein J, partial [Ruminococcus sp.]
LSVRQTEKLTQKAKKGDKTPLKKEEKTNFLKEVELALTDNLCRKVSVTKKGDGGVLSIEFFSQDDLKDLANKLEEKE